jgi:hypothetical protein
MMKMRLRAIPARPRRNGPASENAFCRSSSVLRSTTMFIGFSLMRCSLTRLTLSAYGGQCKLVMKFFRNSNCLGNFGELFSSCAAFEGEGMGLVVRDSF